jgi:hypothetical protein
VDVAIKIADGFCYVYCCKKMFMLGRVCEIKSGGKRAPRNVAAESFS